MSKYNWASIIKAENGNKCSICCLEKVPSVIHFHHVNPEEKKGSIKVFTNQVEARQEAQKCILVCGNCHAEVHAGIHSEEEVLKLPRAVPLDFDFSSIPDSGKRRGKRTVNDKPPKKIKIVEKGDNVETINPNIDIRSEAAMEIFRKDSLEIIKRILNRKDRDFTIYIPFFSSTLVGLLYASLERKYKSKKISVEDRRAMLNMIQRMEKTFNF